MSRLGKQKGSAFERKVASLIRAAAGLQSKDLYRTPMSGGHAQHFKGDLTLSFRAYAVFPFIVECKHRKTWKPLKMFEANKEIRGYFQQVTVAQSKEEDVLRLVIMRGNGGAIYCAFVVNELTNEPDYKRLRRPRFPGIHFEVDKEEWKMMLLSRFLKVVAIAARNRKKKK